MTPKTLILVIGSHRAGTSAVAGSLGLLGVSLGDNLMPPSPANPKGYFEDLLAVSAHDLLLDSVGASWDQPPKRSTSYPGLALVKARTMIRSIVRRLPGPVCAVKDPRATLFVDLWADVCEGEGVRFRVLHVDRRQEASAASLVAREGWEPERAELLVRRYAEIGFGWAERFEYALIQFPWDLGELAIWKGIFEAFDVKHALRVPDMQAVREFVDGGLIHHG